MDAVTASDSRGALGALFDRLARPSLAGVSDGELLDRFARRGDHAAFAEVAHRHGAMVSGVARRVLRCDSGADDVAQAAFVVLARRAGEFAGRGTVGDFLHGVARRLALKARLAQSRRIEVERRAARPELADVPRAVDAGFDADQLLANLPAKYRAAVVLCDLEGVSRRDAASRLGVPEGTVSSRLDAAHKLLAARLQRLGVKLSVAAILAGAATSGAPAGLVRAATAAALITAGHAPGTVPAAVLALVSGGVRLMTLAKLAAGLLAIGMAGGVTAVGVGQTGGDKSKPAEAPDTPAGRVAAPPVAEPESARERAARRRPLVAKETEALDNCYWVAKSKMVNGKAVDLDTAPEIVLLEFTKAAFPPSIPIAPGTNDVVRVYDEAPRIGGRGLGVRLTGSDVVPFKLNPHRTPKEITLARTSRDMTSRLLRGRDEPAPPGTASPAPSQFRSRSTTSTRRSSTRSPATRCGWRAMKGPTKPTGRAGFR